MRVLITGAAGQLGYELQRAFAGEEVLAISRADADIVDRLAIASVIDRFGPDVVVHGAAYTHVDACESNPDLAYQVNALGTQNVALACAAVDAAMLYVSTDYVFDGKKGEPYLEFDDPCPISVYGRSKLAGERYVQTLLNRFYITRTAWLYGVGKNFVKTMIGLVDSRGQVAGVTDETGSPTYARDLAEAIKNIVEFPVYGIYHTVNEGGCSRHELIEAICAATNRRAEIIPMTSAEYLAKNPLPAKRPASAVLRNYCAATSLGIRLRPWRDALEAFVADEGLRLPG